MGLRALANPTGLNSFAIHSITSSAQVGRLVALENSRGVTADRTAGLTPRRCSATATPMQGSVGESQAVAHGKKNSTNPRILMNWQKQGADWKLLSRASTKL